MTDSYQIVVPGMLALASAFTTWIITFLFVHLANKVHFYDHPNHRSSHKAPIVKGGGLVFMTVILAGWYFVNRSVSANALSTIVMLGAVISLLSLTDDIKPLNPWLRLIVQSVVCIITINTLPENQPILHEELPFWFDHTIAFLALIWFCNLYNFMDGIDGLAASETVYICLALIVVGATLNWQFTPHAAIIAGALVAFLYFNWQPARVFMGDVGSIGLGFLLGYLLLQLAVNGNLAPALIIPMYFVFDTTMILLIRMRRGYRLFTPHRTHSIHHAVDAGYSHATTVVTIMLTNMFLFGFAMMSLKYPATGFMISLILVSAVWWGLRKIKPKRATIDHPPDAKP